MKKNFLRVTNPSGGNNILWDNVIFRIFPAFALIVSLVSIILPSWFVPLGNYTVHYPIIFSLVHIVSSILFILILVFPYKFIFYTITGLMFSIYLPFEQADVLYSFFYVVMMLASLYYMDFFKTKRPLKVSLICVFYVVQFIVLVLFHGKAYIQANIFSYIVTLSLIVISVTFVFSIQKIKTEPEDVEKILDVDGFQPFSDRELVILCKIIQNEKYDYIARVLNLSEITVKKAAAGIYKKLDCTDKIDLFSKYSNYAVSRGDCLFLTQERSETKFLAEIIKKERIPSVKS